MKKCLFYLILITIICSCEKSDLLDNTGKFALTTSQLPKLVSGYEYRVWLKSNEFTVLAGNFTIQSNGSQSPTLFQNIDLADLKATDSVYITLDKSSNLGINKKFIIMAGKFNNDNITLSSTDSKSILNDFSGNFQLKTPTTSSTTDELSGIWFYDTSDQPLLKLSTLVSPPFYYQAWLEITVINIKQYFNMGGFTTNIGVDNSKIYSSSQLITPNFPGEDFISDPGGSSIFPLNLALYDPKILVQLVHTNYTANATTPFGFTILYKELDSNLLANTNYLLNKATFTATGFRK